MGYPGLVNWVGFKKGENGTYILKDFVSNCEYSMLKKTVDFIVKLDGKRNPYEIEPSMSEEEVDRLLDTLNELCLLRKGRFLSKSLTDIMFTLWFPCITDKMKAAAGTVNRVIMLSWLPVIAVSLFFVSMKDYDYDLIQLGFGIALGTLTGGLLHEFGHMFACVAYNGKVFEIGLMAEWFSPGAYVLMDFSNVKIRMRRIQIYAAGVEVNFLFAGILCMISCVAGFLDSFFLAAGVANLITGLMNLMLMNSFDGIKIMSELMGIEDFADGAKMLLKNKRKKKSLMDKGFFGKAEVAACYIIRVVQFSMPFITAASILGGLACFI